MLLTLGTPSGFTRRILSPKGEDFVQLRRLRFSSGCAPERSMAPVRNLSSNTATTGSSLKVKGSNSKSLVPESPNLFSPELPGLAQPPEPPDPPDAPPETQDVPSSCKVCKFDSSVCSIQTFMTSSPQVKDPQVHSISTLLLCRPAISGYCSPLLSWTDSVDQWLMCGFSKNLWLRRGNVGSRSLCLTSGTASLSTLVKLIYLNAVVKVALTTVIHSQQRLLLQYFLVLRSQSNAATDVKMEISSEKTYVLGIDGVLYVFDAVDGDRTPRSSKFRHQPENPTSKTTKQIQSVVRSLLKLEDCSPIALTEKANQTSSCRGHERSFSPSLLLIEVNLFIKILLSEKYLSLGFKTKEYRPLPNVLLSGVMARLGQDDTTRFVPLRPEVLEYSTSRHTVTIFKSGKFKGRSNFFMWLLVSGTFVTFDTLSNLSKFVSLSLHCFALNFPIKTAHQCLDVVLIHVTV
ncbi:Uncharacterized protein Rs2_30577 [Raphanus sativus]|nr:Uncharacterized protein Rs2_30577 [Raphanus sativus]